MQRISKWEVAGLPASLLFGAMHRLGWLKVFNVTDDTLIDFMVVAFALAAGARIVQSWLGSRPKPAIEVTPKEEE